ncbi:MAG: hypothetical protein ABIS69_06385 [Sediminibacterium sp.]
MLVKESDVLNCRSKKNNRKMPASIIIDLFSYFFENYSIEGITITLVRIVSTRQEILLLNIKLSIDEDLFSLVLKTRIYPCLPRIGKKAKAVAHLTG